MKALSGPELPPASGKKAKNLVILLHGVGADGNDLIGLAPEYAEALPDTHFCSPNAPFHFDMSPFGYQWFSLQSYMEHGPLGVIENPELMNHLMQDAHLAAAPLNAYIDAKLDELELDVSALGIVGFSQGTMMALHTALRRPKPCAAVVGYSGGLLATDSLPDQIKSRPPICLIHGKMDEVVPFMFMHKAEKDLINNGIKVECHERPFLSHSIDSKGIELGREFLKRHF